MLQAGVGLLSLSSVPSNLTNISAADTTADVPLAEQGSAFLEVFQGGLKLVCQPMPTLVVCVDIWIPTGSAGEQHGSFGIAHLLEHMIFRGTDFDFLIESQGGISSAATSLDYTHFSFTVPAQGLWTTLPYLANMLLQPKWTESDFQQEKAVVLEEIAQCYDDPDWMAFQLLQQTAYGDHGYGRSVLGTMADVEQITLEQICQFHALHYRPEQMTIAITGDVVVQQVRTLVLESFVSGAGRRDAPKPAIAPQISDRRSAYLNHLSHCRLFLSWLGVPASCWQEGLGLDLVATLLTGGRSSRLVGLLREQWGWVYDIDCGFALQRQAGLFTISACLESCYLEPVEHHILMEVEALAQGKITDLELAKAKRSLCNSFIFGMESPQTLASFLGYHTMLGCDELCTGWAERYCQVIQQLTISDVQRLAERYLASDRSVVVTCLPH
jgi:Predicted Zn-dependent peptidases